MKLFWAQQIWMNLHLNITMIVSTVQQNLPCKIYMRISLNLYVWICFYKYNCKHCSTKYSLQNLHENFHIFFKNEFAFKYKYNCKYCSANFPQKATFKYIYEKRIMDILTSLQYKPLSNINRSEKWGKKNTNRGL